MLCFVLLVGLCFVCFDVCWFACFVFSVLGFFVLFCYFYVLCVGCVLWCVMDVSLYVLLFLLIGCFDVWFIVLLFLLLSVLF